MSVQVTMLQTRRGEDGELWTVAGSPYTASDAFAAFLISSNLATGALPEVPQSNLTAEHVATVREAIGDDEASLLSVRYESATDSMRSGAQVLTYQDVLNTTAAVSFVATQASKRVLLSWTDQRPLKGCTTNAAGYAAGIKTITLASAGSGALYKGDVVNFTGQDNEYTLLAGDADVSGGGTITLAGYGLAAAIEASATAITLVRRGARAFLALDCDNAVEALVATQDVRQRDAEITLGETLTVQSPVAISSVWASAEVSLLNTTHRLDVIFGE